MALGVRHILDSRWDLLVGAQGRQLPPASLALEPASWGCHCAMSVQGRSPRYRVWPRCQALGRCMHLMRPQVRKRQETSCEEPGFEQGSADLQSPYLESLAPQPRYDLIHSNAGPVAWWGVTYQAPAPHLPGSPCSQDPP